jgi:hypothetical protein
LFERVFASCANGCAPARWSWPKRHDPSGGSWCILLRGSITCAVCHSDVHLLQQYLES